MFSCGSVFGRFFVFPVARYSVVFVVFGRDAYVVFNHGKYVVAEANGALNANRKRERHL